MKKEKNDLESKKKLNWLEKKAVKRIIKKARIIIAKYVEQMETEKKARDKLEKELIEMTDILEIETDDNELLDKDNIKKLTNKEIEETLEMAINEMEKMI